MTKILFHDFQPNRPRYERVLEFCSIEERSEGLVVLAPRRDTDPLALRALKLKFEHIPQ